MKPKYYCHYMKKPCQFGGNKSFNYGFYSGTSSYCYKVSKFTHDLKQCPEVSQESKEAEKQQLTGKGQNV